MMPPRACWYFHFYALLTRSRTVHILDYFLGLNAIRGLSIIALILVFASSIFVLVNDIQAVNRAMASPQDMTDCDYIECVPDAILPSFRTSSKNTPALTCFHSQG